MAVAGGAGVLILGAAVALHAAGAVELTPGWVAALSALACGAPLAVLGLGLGGGRGTPAAADPRLGPPRPRAAPAATTPARSASPATPVAERPRLLLGTAGALARRLDLSPAAVRAAFVVLAVAGGAGVPLYLLASVALPEVGFAQRVRGGGGVGVLLVLGAALLAVREAGLPFSDAVAWPMLLALVGALVLLGARGGGTAPAAGGVALVAAAVVSFLIATGALRDARPVALAVVAVLAAVAVILGPWLIAQARALAAERAERIRSQERAEVAAHLHDSVLQTLALVQRRSDEPAQVVALARRQERELRAWLAGKEGGASHLRGALEDAAAAVEADHGAEVEVVAVGDAPMDGRREALVAAAREAMANAAQHAGGVPVDVYAEVGDDGAATVFVRDRGPGFDPDAVPEDRRGVRESIVGRMERHGGTARVTSAPGQGTEVELELPR